MNETIGDEVSENEAFCSKKENETQLGSFETKADGMANSLSSFSLGPINTCNDLVSEHLRVQVTSFFFSRFNQRRRKKNGLKSKA